MIVKQIGRIEIFGSDGDTLGIRKRIADIFDEDESYIVAKEGNRYLLIFEEEREKKEKKGKKK